MVAVEWPFTRLGRDFFGGQLPRLVRALEALAVEAKRHNDEIESRKSKTTTGGD
jgi:hypothetical protein